MWNNVISMQTICIISKIKIFFINQIFTRSFQSFHLIQFYFHFLVPSFITIFYPHLSFWYFISMFNFVYFMWVTVIFNFKRFEFFSTFIRTLSMFNSWWIVWPIYHFSYWIPYLHIHTWYYLSIYLSIYPSIFFYIYSTIHLFFQLCE